MCVFIYPAWHQNRRSCHVKSIEIVNLTGLPQVCLLLVLPWLPKTGEWKPDVEMPRVSWLNGRRVWLNGPHIWSYSVFNHTGLGIVNCWLCVCAIFIFCLDCFENLWTKYWSIMPLLPLLKSRILIQIDQFSLGKNTWYLWETHACPKIVRAIIDATCTIYFCCLVSTIFGGLLLEWNQLLGSTAPFDHRTDQANKVSPWMTSWCPRARVATFVGACGAVRRHISSGRSGSGSKFCRMPQRFQRVIDVSNICKIV